MPTQEKGCEYFKQKIEKLKSDFARLSILSNTDLTEQDIDIEQCVETHDKYYELCTFVDGTLPQLREEINDLGRIYVEIGGKRIELGPTITLNEAEFNQVSTKLAEVNKTLKEGEDPWRIFTKEEFEELGAPIRAIWKDNTLTSDQIKEKAKELVESLGFIWASDYLSSTAPDHLYLPHWFLNTSDGRMYPIGQSLWFRVRCVR